MHATMNWMTIFNNQQKSFRQKFTATQCDALLLRLAEMTRMETVK